MIKGVIFDLDNTLIDFVKMKDLAIEAAINYMIDAGLNMDKEEIKKEIYKIYEEKGIEYQEVFQDFLLKKFGEIDYKILAAGIVGYRRAKDFSLVPYPHTEYTLLELIKRGLKLAVISDAPKLQAYLRLCYLGFLNYFDCVVAYEDTKKKKPDPEPFLLVLKKLNLEPKEVIMVGDWRERDIIGAKLVGIKTAFARYGDTFNTKESNADYELNDIIEIIKIVDELNKKR
ncbi:MAG: HAD-IA family hydrolase [candidate division WOR-3 bacterium]|nr:HAD-IA family hydrolase [candidate division WOR-3 bacterium]MCX7836845.1 HAD-IA family hydrolase [candidate division WOR-3 bacterium]MDW8114286.1 HAD-IA family hydrolase [candidate division WOR-3 bacterium]